MVLPPRHLHWELFLPQSHHAYVAVLIALAKIAYVMNLVVHVRPAVLAPATLPVVHVVAAAR